jgi:cytochrome b561
MALRNSHSAWGAIARTFHWLIAVLAIFLIAYGGWMAHFAPRPDRLMHYSFHSSIGYDLLLLLVFRLCWRAMDPAPLTPPGMVRWERVAAMSSHFLLYVLLLAVSVTGWLLAGTLRRPLSATLLGFIPVPVLNNSGDRAFHDLMEHTHQILSYVLLALVVVHVAAALRHHYIKKNDVLRRMW